MTRGTGLLPLLLAAGALALATGCTSIPQIRVPETVKVQVPVPCIDPAARPRRPATRTEPDLMAMELYRRTLATWGDLVSLRAYSAELEAVVEGCSRIPAATGR